MQIWIGSPGPWAQSNAVLIPEYTGSNKKFTEIDFCQVSPSTCAPWGPLSGSLTWSVAPSHRAWVVFMMGEREKMFYLMTHSTYFIYGYMASDIWLRTILIVREETRCRHIGYSYRLTARVLLYAPSHRQDNTYHGLCYTSRGALAGTRNSSMGPPHEGSIRRPTAPWANALPLSYVPLLTSKWSYVFANLRWPL